MKTVLVIEDEEAIRSNIVELLEIEGYRTLEAENGRAGVQAAREHLPGLIISDVMMPELDGFGVLEELRQDPVTATIPFIFLTAKAERSDLRQGMELGADDYLTKPFGLRELMSRIKALLRRSYGDLADAGGGRVIRHRDLVIDLERRRVQRGARRIALTPTEFEILRHLASRPGRVYTRGELLELLRDYEALDQDEKTINVHVSHLREKIEDDPATPGFVLTVRGVGYAFAER